MTLLNVPMTPPASEVPSVYDSSSRTVFVYVPLAVAVLLLLLPHPSFVIMLSSHYLKTLQSPAAFWTHLLAVYFLAFLAFSSLMACVIRNPGRVTSMPSRKPASTVSGQDDEADVALLDGEEDQVDDVDELKGSGRWCRRCELRRPERAHHCSMCGYCVLKMDHHCPWLGGNCVGYRTYPSFLHFILSTTLLAAYITFVALSVVVHLVSDPFSIDPHVTPLHPLFLTLMGAIFTLTMGSFFVYHIYLVSTNQTTLEHITPFLLLRYIPVIHRPENDTSQISHSLPEPTPISYPQSRSPSNERHPPPPSSPRTRPTISTTFADPPTPPSQSPFMSPLTPSTTFNSYPLEPTPPYAFATSRVYPGHTLGEHELSPAQRRFVQHMHGKLRPYDIGFRANWGQVFGGGKRGWAQWAHLILWGGTPRGDGRTFQRGPKVQAELDRLARQLNDIRQEERTR